MAARAVLVGLQRVDYVDRLLPGDHRHLVHMRIHGLVARNAMAARARGNLAPGRLGIA